MGIVFEVLFDLIWISLLLKLKERSPRLFWIVGVWLPLLLLALLFGLIYYYNGWS